MFGLSKSKPLKNDKISHSRALEIAELLPELNLLINIYFLDLSDKDLQSTVKLNEDFSNIFREMYRNVRQRPIAQILYNEVLGYTLFSSISDYIELHQISSQFSIYVDNWTFPNCDSNISLKMRSKVLSRKHNEYLQKSFPGVKVACDNIELLDQDNHKKRFIDVLTSVVSRNFLGDTNPKYSNSILKIIFRNNNYDVSKHDITKITVDRLRKIMDNISRNG